MCFGYNLGGKRFCMLIQNTAIGNLITELLTLPELYGVPLPIFLSWRGHYQEPIEAQTVLGEKMTAILEALQVSYTVVENPNDVTKIDKGLESCFDMHRAHVFLLSPQLWDNVSPPKASVAGMPAFEAKKVSDIGYSGQPELTRYGAIQTIVESLSDKEILFPQIGFPAREVYATGDRDRNFYLLGALGSASLVGLGYAICRPDLHVTVLDGDGAMVFNPNQMMELAQYMPNNLRVVVLDNGSWGSTGNQPTLTSTGTNLALIGQACGLKPWRRVTSRQEWADAIAENTSQQVIHFMISPGNAKVGNIDLKASEIVARFTAATTK